MKIQGWLNAGGAGWRVIDLAQQQSHILDVLVYNFSRDNW